MSTPAPTLALLTDTEKTAAVATIGADRLLLIPDPSYADDDEAKKKVSPGYIVVAYNGTMSRRVGTVYDARADRAFSRRPKNATWIYLAEGYDPHQCEVYDEDDPTGNPWENKPVDIWTPVGV